MCKIGLNIKICHSVKVLSLSPLPTKSRDPKITVARLRANFNLHFEARKLTVACFPLLPLILLLPLAPPPPGSRALPPVLPSTPHGPVFLCVSPPRWSGAKVGVYLPPTSGTPGHLNRLGKQTIHQSRCPLFRGNRSWCSTAASRTHMGPQMASIRPASSFFIPTRFIPRPRCTGSQPLSAYKHL